MWRELLQTQRDPLLVLVKVKDDNIELLIDLQNFGRMTDPAPGNVRDIQQTIDTTQIWFKTAARDYVIIDAPGHREFLKNMVSGAAAADAAVLVVDAAEGVREQTRRHGYLLHLLGVRQVAVAVSKMDLVDYGEARFAEVSREITHYLGEIGVVPTFIVPISGRDGDNVAGTDGRCPILQRRQLTALAEGPQAQLLALQPQPVSFPDAQSILSTPRPRRRVN